MLISSRWAFPLAMVFTLAATLLPTPWLGWTKLPSELASLVLGPFGHVAGEAGAALRSPPPQPIDFDGTQEQYIEHLRRERDEFERMFLAEQDKAIRLREDLESIEKIPREAFSSTVRPITANIVQRVPGKTLEPVILSRGSDHGVKPGTIAVVDGVNLVGRILDVTAMQSRLLPLANKATPPIRVTIHPRDRESDASQSLRVWQAFPTGDGAFTADVERSAVISQGDIVRLADTPPAWPEAAQAMVVGIVESVQTKPSEPLRNAVVIRPRYQVAQVAKVILKVEEDQPDESGPSGGGGR